MINYPGTNPVTVFPVSPAVGYGVWATPQEAEGGDKRSAANMMAIGEALTHRANFVGWRIINIVDGGTYTFTTTVYLKNALWFTNPTGCGVDAAGVWFNKGLEYVTGWSASKSMQIGHSSVGVGLLKVRTGSAIIANGGSKADATLYADSDLSGSDAVIAVDGANGRLHISQDAGGTFYGSTKHGKPGNVAQGGTTATFHHPIVQNGVDGYHVKRRHTATFSGSSSSSVTISNPEQYDIIRCTRCSCTDGGTTLVCTLNLDAPDAATPDGVTLRVYVGQGAYLEQSGNTSATLDVVAHGVTYRKNVPLTVAGANTEEAVGMTFEVLSNEWVSMG